MPQMFSPWVARNRDPILEVMRRVLPPTGTVLEMASGTGEHAAYFAAAFPGLTWQPTDIDDQALRSIASHRSVAGLPNLLAPLLLDVCQRPWPLQSADVIVSINMVHIAPWTAAQCLFAGAGQVLRPGGTLFLYGPFVEDDHPLAPSNAAFDQSLRERNPEWGIRNLTHVAQLAERNALQLVERAQMPANNLALVFGRA